MVSNKASYLLFLSHENRMLVVAWLVELSVFPGIVSAIYIGQYPSGLLRFSQDIASRNKQVIDNLPVLIGCFFNPGKVDFPAGKNRLILTLEAVLILIAEFGHGHGSIIIIIRDRACLVVSRRERDGSVRSAVSTPGRSRISRIGSFRSGIRNIGR